MKIFILVFLMWTAVAQAQWSPWNQYQLLIDDTVSCAFPDFAIDDSFRLHVFYVRMIRPYDPQMKCLYYQRFDNWGNPLSSPMEVLPDTTPHYEFDPGVLHSRNGDLHIVWLRIFPDMPEGTEFSVYYARMSVDGEFLTPPYPLPYETRSVYPSYVISLVQDCTGVVWFTCGNHYGAVTETGQLIKPLKPIPTDPERYGLNPKIALTPNDEIWACDRISGGGIPQNISMTRLDTSVQQWEVISPNNPDHEIFGMGPSGFLVDDTGVFHFILCREDCGFFYQRDPRNGQVDTIRLSSSLYSDTRLTMASDTLVYMWCGGGTKRVGISLDGELVLGPETLSWPTWNPLIYFETPRRLIWKAGSYWLITNGRIDNREQLYLIHVPGPNEPPPRPSAVQWYALPGSPSLSLYPNPLNPSGRITVNLLQRGLCTIDLYDVLGRHAATIANSVFEPGRYEFPLDARDLPTGTYFVHLQSGQQTVIQKAVILK